jgi:signal transduction histidine kinase
MREKDHLMIQQSRQAAMGEMISNIAHQWRQPLTAVGAIIQSFEDAYEDKELTAEYLEEKIEMVMDILQHMSQTIDDFRNFFRPNKLEEEFDISENINNTVKLISSNFKYNKINLQLELNEEIIIRGFPNEFSQVILIILNNAKDALIQNRIKNPQVTIKVEKTDERNLVKIRDNGGGIKLDNIYNIFEPYFSTKEAGKGTGLGLYMSKMIIEKNMGGQLDVRNTKDGAEFIISFSK